MIKDRAVAHNAITTVLNTDPVTFSMQTYENIAF